MSKYPDVLGRIEAVWNIHGGEEGIDRLLRNETIVVERRPKISPALDTLIRVDRSVHPSYPEWVKEVLHPELECSGPTTFDLAHVEPWLHDGQKDGGIVTGQVIFDFLKSSGTLGNHLGLVDALEIQKKGIATFRKVFGKNVVFFWKSVVRLRSGNLRVPCLCDDGARVVLFWRWLGSGWNASNPAARLAS